MSGSPTTRWCAGPRTRARRDIGITRCKPAGSTSTEPDRVSRCSIRRILRDVSVRAVAVAETPADRASCSAALDDKIAANDRVIVAAEALMVAIAESVSDYVPLSSLANRSTAFARPERIRRHGRPLQPSGVRRRRETRSWSTGASVRSGKFLLSEPCVLFAKLNPRIPRIWNVVSLPSEMALASTEFVVLSADRMSIHRRYGRRVRQPECLADACSSRSPGPQAATSGSGRATCSMSGCETSAGLAPAASRTITGLGALCHARRAECSRLSRLPRALLPLLMSGEVHGSRAGRRQPGSTASAWLR